MKLCYIMTRNSMSFYCACVSVVSPKYTKPGLQAEKNRAHINTKKFSDDGLSGYTVSSLQAARHRYRYILFVFMGSSRFFPPAVRG